jgi:antitoxin ParD1/3/4
MDIFIIFDILKFKSMNVSLTKKQQEYIANQIESGDFQNASELVRDALRLHETYRHRVILDLKAEIEKGWSGATSKRNIKDIINDKRKKAS